jgi:hypothetical protein
MVRFEEYFKEPELHSPELVDYVQQLELANAIFYGPPGVGKYSLILKYIRKFSDSRLKYSRKLTITYDTKTYQFQMSDVHYEIDMAIFTYNSKLLWHEIYQQLRDAITANRKRGIILCKNFHEINNELLDNFYNYLQHPLITFVIMTEHVSFISDNILQSSNMVYVPRPSRENYESILSSSSSSAATDLVDVSSMINIKCPSMTATHIPMCNQIIKYMEDLTNFDYFTFRNYIYTVLVYNIDVYSSVWYILNHFIQNHGYPVEVITDITEHLLKFLHLYNNNHHNIYHIEYFLCYLTNVYLRHVDGGKSDRGAGDLSLSVPSSPPILAVLPL